MTETNRKFNHKILRLNLRLKSIKMKSRKQEDNSHKRKQAPGI